MAKKDMDKGGTYSLKQFLGGVGGERMICTC